LRGGLIRGLPLRFSAREHAWLAQFGLGTFGVGYVLRLLTPSSMLVSGLVAVGYSASPLLGMLGMRLFFGAPMTRRVALASAPRDCRHRRGFYPELARLQGSAETVKGCLHHAQRTWLLRSAASSRTATSGPGCRCAKGWRLWKLSHVTETIALDKRYAGSRLGTLVMGRWVLDPFPFDDPTARCDLRLLLARSGVFFPACSGGSIAAFSAKRLFFTLPKRQFGARVGRGYFGVSHWLARFRRVCSCSAGGFRGAFSLSPPRLTWGRAFSAV